MLPPSPLPPSHAAFYITIFRHHARDLLPPDTTLCAIIFSFCLFFLHVNFFSLSSFPFSPSLYLYLWNRRPFVGLSWKIMLGRALCISNAGEPVGRPDGRTNELGIDRESRTYRLTTLKGNNLDGDAGRLGRGTDSIYARASAERA